MRRRKHALRGCQRHLRLRRLRCQLRRRLHPHRELRRSLLVHGVLTMNLRLSLGLISVLAAGVVGCSSSGSSSGGMSPDPYAPEIDAKNFSTTIDNPYTPWPPGMVLTYVEDEEYTITVTVTEDTRQVMGVDCVVVHDVLTDVD